MFKRRSRLISVASSSLRETVLPKEKCGACVTDYAALEEHSCWSPSQDLVPLPDTTSHPVSQVDSKPSRKILVVGSSYDGKERKTATIFSVATLDAALDDKEDLKHAFEQRGYSTHSFINNQFTRKDVLRKVADFFQDAEEGDVRAVVFTGHGYRQDDGPVMLIPPHCSGIDDAISEQEWEANIRSHTKAGVV
ncbi:hypothetical protein FRC07_014575, partial [Ceratobasidium sp. 392]